MSTVGAATFTALLTTAATYPLDLAHGRMAADMSKKVSMVATSKNAPI
jgi:type IV secretory pathway VirB6-like protein